MASLIAHLSLTACLAAIPRQVVWQRVQRHDQGQRAGECDAGGSQACVCLQERGLGQAIREALNSKQGLHALPSSLASLVSAPLHPPSHPLPVRPTPTPNRPTWTSCPASRGATRRRFAATWGATGGPGGACVCGCGQGEGTCVVVSAAHWGWLARAVPTSAYGTARRRRYFTPDQAVEYGIIDKVVQPSDDVAVSCTRECHLTCPASILCLPGSRQHPGRDRWLHPANPATPCETLCRRLSGATMRACCAPARRRLAARAAAAAPWPARMRDWCAVWLRM